MRAKITVTYSDDIGVYEEYPKRVEGLVRSYYNPREILSEDGGYIFDDLSFTEGWIITDKNFNVLEKNIYGHVSLEVEEWV